MNNSKNKNTMGNKMWYHTNRLHFAGNQKHPFHMVTRSPWPMLSSLAALMFTFSMVLYMHKAVICAGYVVLVSLFFVLIMMFVWWRDVMSESSFGGYHTKKVQMGLRYGVILFMVSELMLFFSFFWAFFHSSLSPSIVLGSVWPPLGMNVLNPLQMPLLNTLILLLSGFTVTWSHHVMSDKSWQKPLLSTTTSGNSISDLNLIEKDNFVNNFIICYFSLFLTILLGLEFTFWQAYEYYKATFYIFDGMYSSTFYLTTGLHGFHVIVGTLFLMVCFFSLISLHFTHNHHFGYEAAIWYWHFVDVVWIFLFLSIYCWGSGISSFYK